MEILSTETRYELSTVTQDIDEEYMLRDQVLAGPSIWIVKTLTMKTEKEWRRRNEAMLMPSFSE